MKITRLQINNFAHVALLDIKDMTNTTVLTGKNGVGKTTILNALTFAFGFDVRDARGITIKNKELIGPAADSLSVKLLMEIDGRQLKLTASIGKDRGVEIEDVAKKMPAFLEAKGITATYAALYAAMGMEPAHIECALSPRAYLLGPDLGNILAAMCAGQWTNDDVKASAGEHWPYLSKYFTGNSVSLETVGKTCFDTRTGIKKLLASAKADIERIGEIEQPMSRDGKPLDENQIPIIEDALRGLNVQRDALIAELGAASSNAASNRTTLEANLSSALVDLEFAAAEMGKLEKVYKASVDTLQSASNALNSVNESYSRAKAEHGAALALVASRKSASDTCETCGHTLSADEKTQLICAAESALKQASDALSAINIDDAKVKFDAFELENKQAREAYHAAQREFDRLSAEKSRIEYDLEKMGAVKAQRNADEIQTEIETMNERISAGMEKMAQLKAWSELQKMKACIPDFEADIAHLDWAVVAFRDGEFIKSRLAGSANVFEDGCNEKLSAFGYSLKVVVDGKSAQVWLQKGDLPAAPITRCSKAELVLAGYAVACAFGTNCPICIDDMDAMFSETKSKFVAQLKSRNSEQAPIFASGAWTAGAVDLEPITKYLSDAKVVWVGEN